MNIPQTPPSKEEIAESIHYRVVVTVCEITGLPERKTRDTVAITTTAKDARTALVQARDYLDMAADHHTEGKS